MYVCLNHRATWEKGIWQQQWQLVGSLASLVFQLIANCCLISQSFCSQVMGGGRGVVLSSFYRTQALKPGPPPMDLGDNPAQGGRGGKCESNARR